MGIGALVGDGAGAGVRLQMAFWKKEQTGWVVLQLVVAPQQENWPGGHALQGVPYVDTGIL